MSHIIFPYRGKNGRFLWVLAKFVLFKNSEVYNLTRYIKMKAINALFNNLSFVKVLCLFQILFTTIRFLDKIATKFVKIILHKKNEI